MTRLVVVKCGQIEFLVNDFGADDVFLDVPAEVEEHVVVFLEPLLASILIPLILPLPALRDRQHRVEVHEVLRSVDTELFKAIVAENNVLQIESLKFWCLLSRVHTVSDDVIRVVFDFQRESFQVRKVTQVKNLWRSVQSNEKLLQIRESRDDSIEFARAFKEAQRKFLDVLDPVLIQ